MKKYLFPILLIGFWSCEEEVKEDTTPPTVSITTAFTGFVSEIVNISVMVTDDEGIDKVELWVDGINTGTTDDAEPYTLNWNTSSYEDSSAHIIVVRVYDTSGNIADSQPVTLTIDNTESAPQGGDITLVTYTLTEMIIAWEQSEDEDLQSYKLLYSETENGDKDTIATYTEKTTTSHTITEFDPFHENWFWVQLTDTLGFSRVGTGMTNDVESPPTQIDFTSVYYGSESINISWQKSSDDDFSSYQLLYSETYNGEQTFITTISDINNTSYIFTRFNSLEDRWYWIKVSDYWNLETISDGYNFEITPIAFSEDFTNPNENWSLNQYFSFQGGVLIHNGVDDGYGHHANLYYFFISNDGDMLATPFELSADVKLTSTGVNTYRSIGFASSDSTRYYLSIYGNSWKFVSWESTEGWADIISWTFNENITSEGRLKILCLESTISLYVDDHLLGSSQFDMGSQLSTRLHMYSQNDAVVEFDNIKLYGDFIYSSNRQLISNEGDRASILTREEKDLNMPENDHNRE